MWEFLICSINVMLCFIIFSYNYGWRGRGREFTSQQSPIQTKHKLHQLMERRERKKASGAAQGQNAGGTDVRDIRQLSVYTQREPVQQQKEGDHLSEELVKIQKFLVEVIEKQSLLEREIKEFREEMCSMRSNMEQLMDKMSQTQQVRASAPQCGPPPPPLPPPPPPPPATRLPVQAHTMARCASLLPKIPRFTITVQDIANVKLKKNTHNPARNKPQKNEIQPLVTQQMLKTTRAKLGRTRSMAASSSKQQHSELECLLQDCVTVTSYRKRVAKNTFQSAEEMRVRPYTSARGAPRSPRSPCSPRFPRSPRPPRSPRSRYLML